VELGADIRDERISVKGYVDTPNGQIHYREEGAGEPVLLLHQAPSSSEMWEALLPRLAALGYRAIAIDLPGYGMSDPPPAPPELTDYAASILAAARGLGLDRFAVIGHHTGGSVALTMAVEQPERVRGLVVYGVALLSEERARTLAEEQPPDSEETGAEVARAWGVYWGLASPDLAPRIATRSVTEMLLAGGLRQYGHNSVGRADHVALLESLRRPMLALAGRREMLHAQSQEAAARSPWITFHELGDAGIFAADEDPEAFARVVDEFLRQPDPELDPPAEVVVG
jgi:pimeloyl-ACP methyl ester carboxylesterase